MSNMEGLKNTICAFECCIYPITEGGCSECCGYKNGKCQFNKLNDVRVPIRLAEKMLSIAKLYRDMEKEARDKTDDPMFSVIVPLMIPFDDLENFDLAYIEYREWGPAWFSGIVPSVIRRVDVREIRGIYVENMKSRTDNFLREDEYNKTWRCWTSMPSVNKRQAVKWEWRPNDEASTDNH